MATFLSASSASGSAVTGAPYEAFCGVLSATAPKAIERASVSRIGSNDPPGGTKRNVLASKFCFIRPSLWCQGRCAAILNPPPLCGRVVLGGGLPGWLTGVRVAAHLRAGVVGGVSPAASGGPGSCFGIHES